MASSFHVFLFLVHLTLTVVKATPITTYDLLNLPNCLTYSDPTSGSQVTFASCNSNDIKQTSWSLISPKDTNNGTKLICTMDNLCMAVSNKNEKARLLVKNRADPAQQWNLAKNNTLTNVLIGSNLCATSWIGLFFKHLYMSTCSSSYNRFQYFIVG